MAAMSDGDVPDLTAGVDDPDGGDDTTTAAKAPPEDDDRTLKASVKTTPSGVNAEVAPRAQLGPRFPAPVPAAGRPMHAHGAAVAMTSKKATQLGLGPVSPATRPIPSSPVVGPIETLPRLGTRDDTSEDGATGTHTATAPSFVTASGAFFPSLSVPGAVQIREIAGVEAEGELFDETEVRTAVNEDLQTANLPPLPAAGAPYPGPPLAQPAPPASSKLESSPPDSAGVPAIEAYDSDDSVTTRAPRVSDGWQPETPVLPSRLPQSAATLTASGAMVSPMVSPAAMSAAMPSLPTQPAFSPLVSMGPPVPSGPVPTSPSAGVIAANALSAGAPKNVFVQTLASAVSSPARAIMGSPAQPRKLDSDDAYTTEESVTSKAIDMDAALEGAYEDDSVTAFSPFPRSSASGRAAPNLAPSSAGGASPADSEPGSITAAAPAPLVGGNTLRSLVDPADEDEGSDASANRTQVMRNAPMKQGGPVLGVGAGDRARAVRRAPVALGGAPMASLGSGNAVRAEYSAPVEAESDSGLRAAPPDPVKADHASIGAIMSRPGQELPRRSGIGLASDHASASGQVPVYAGGPGAGGAIVTPMGAPALAAAPSQAQAPQLSRPVDFAATIQKKPRYGSVAVGVLAICFAAAMTVFIWHRLQARAGADVNSNAAAAGAAPAADENASSSAPANASGEASARAPAEVSSDRTTWGEPVRPRAPGTATTSNPSPSPPSRGRRDGRRH